MDKYANDVVFLDGNRPRLPSIQKEKGPCPVSRPGWITITVRIPLSRLPERASKGRVILRRPSFRALLTRTDALLELAEPVGFSSVANNGDCGNIDLRTEEASFWI